MTTPVPPAGEAAHAHGDQQLADPGERGTLTIGRSVVRKVAQQAADTVVGTTKARRVAGIGRGEHGARAKVADGSGDQVDIKLDIAMHYPVSVRAIVADVRKKVTSEVERIASRQVRTLDVMVSALLPDLPPRVH